VTVGTGLSALAPSGDIVHLATWSCAVSTTDDGVTFAIRPLDDITSEFTNAPGYFDRDDLGTGYAVGNSSGGEPGDTGAAWDSPCGSINVGGSVATGSTTWSSVKSIFR